MRTSRVRERPCPVSASGWGSLPRVPQLHRRCDPLGHVHGCRKVSNVVRFMPWERWRLGGNSSGGRGATAFASGVDAQLRLSRKTGQIGCDELARLFHYNHLSPRGQRSGETTPGNQILGQRRRPRLQGHALSRPGRRTACGSLPRLRRRPEPVAFAPGVGSRDEAEKKPRFRPRATRDITWPLNFTFKKHPDVPKMVIL